MYEFTSATRSGLGIMEGAGAHRVIIDDSMIQAGHSDDGRIIVFDSERNGGVTHIFVNERRRLRPAARDERRGQIGTSDHARRKADHIFNRRLLAVADVACWRGARQDRRKPLLPGRRLLARLEVRRSSAVAGRRKRRERSHSRAAARRRRTAPRPAYGRIRRLRWAPAGDAVTSSATSAAGRHFLQPLSGGEPVPLTQFIEGTINDYDWTTEGKLVRGRGCLGKRLDPHPRFPERERETPFLSVASPAQLEPPSGTWQVNSSQSGFI